MIHWPADPSFHVHGANGWSLCGQFLDRPFFTHRKRDVTCPGCRGFLRPTAPPKKKPKPSS